MGGIETKWENDSRVWLAFQQKIKIKKEFVVLVYKTYENLVEKYISEYYRPCHPYHPINEISPSYDEIGNSMDTGNLKEEVNETSTTYKDWL